MLWLRGCSRHTCISLHGESFTRSLARFVGSSGGGATGIASKEAEEGVQLALRETHVVPCDVVDELRDKGITNIDSTGQSLATRLTTNWSLHGGISPATGEVLHHTMV